MKLENIRNEIAEIVSSVSKIDVAVDDITDSTSLLEDLSFDSITFIILIISIESKYDIELDDDALFFDSSNTFGQLCACVSNILENRISPEA